MQAGLVRASTKQDVIEPRSVAWAREPKGNEMKSRRLAFVAASAIAALGVLAPVARAGGVTFVRTAENGTVDFGDWVRYQLTGTGCAGHTVVVRVDGPGATDAVSERNLASPSCDGVVRVPTEDVVRAKTGWSAGAPVAIRLESGDQILPLRYQRVEVDQGTTATGGALTTVPSVDGRQDPGDLAVPMSTGDIVKLGRVNLTSIYSISLRVCVTLPKPHLTPSLVELRAGRPDAPSIIGRVDVADDVNNSNKSNFGWPDCWQLQPWPIINKIPEAEPELFLAMVATAAPVKVTYIDFNGTGAVKQPDRLEPDPARMSTIFDGTDATVGAWTIGEKCTIDPSDDSVHATHSTEPTNYAPLATFGFVGESGCTMAYEPPVKDVMIKFQYRLQDFEDNGAIYIDGHEIQMREAGEWMTGGIQGNTLPDALTNFAVDNPPSGYPAQRIKSNTFPDWSEMEIVQFGRRYVVRINGRTVTDCTSCFEAPVEAYQFSLTTQPNFSYRYGAGYRMDTGPTNPTTDDPSNWGNISFRNFRLYQCTEAANDPCATVPGVSG